MLCNGQRLALLREEEEVLFRLAEADTPATLAVKMGTIESKPFVVRKLRGSLDLECGVEGWTILDFFNLLSSRTRARPLYLRKVSY